MILRPTYPYPIPKCKKTRYGSIPSRRTTSSRRARTRFLFFCLFLIPNFFQHVFELTQLRREKYLALCLTSQVLRRHLSEKKPFKSLIVSEAKQTLNLLTFKEKIQTPTDTKIAALFIHLAFPSNTTRNT